MSQIVEKLIGKRGERGREDGNWFRSLWGEQTVSLELMYHSLRSWTDPRLAKQLSTRRHTRRTSRLHF